MECLQVVETWVQLSLCEKGMYIIFKLWRFIVICKILNVIE